MTHRHNARIRLAAGATLAIPLALALTVPTVRPAEAQISTLPGFILAQGSTPGSAQVAHAHITGRMIAGSFEGNGAALNGLDAGNVSTGLLAPQFGGLGLDTSGVAAGSMLYGTGGAWATLDPAADGTVLTMVGGSPAWVAGSGSLSLPFGGFGDDGGGDALFRIENSGVGAAVMGITAGPLGIGVRGESTDTTTYSVGGHFTSNSPLGRGVFAQNLSETGPSIAGRFGSGSPDTTVVYATASSTGDGDATAVRGESFAISGTGVYGIATGSTPNRFPVGVQGDASNKDGAGVYGYNGATTGRSTGVYAASANISAGSAALFVFGNSFVAGTKSFLIDHPTDPTNKNLRHYCSEGPAPTNVYHGRVTTGSDGTAWVRLPDYFQDVNKDPDYQLTVIDASDDFVLAKVIKEVRDNKFQIRTSKARVTVCWEVKATRNDRWVQATGFSDIEEKPASEKGKYLVPQLYGRPLSEAVNPRLARGNEPRSSVGRP